MKLKKSYDNFEPASDETGLDCQDPSLTQQHDEPGANINNIVNTYLRTGMVETHNLPPLQGDFSAAPDMQTAMNLGIEARLAFMEQPATVRKRFNNDPTEFVDFCSDPANMAEMNKLGLLNDEATARIEAQRAKEQAQFKQDQEDAAAYRTQQKTNNK